MGEVLFGLALFFCVLWGVPTVRRMLEARETASLEAERERQEKKWADEVARAAGSAAAERNASLRASVIKEAAGPEGDRP
ncbi:MAG: hypothetical protein WA294_06980 [Acidobacteriaceae bacterium]